MFLACFRETLTRPCIRLRTFLILIVCTVLSADNITDEEVFLLDDDECEEANTLIVRQRVAAPLSPSSKTITANEFQGKFSDLPSVLETIAGVHIRSMGGYGQYAESSIRGGAASGLRIYLDGVQLNSAAAGAVDLSKIPLDRIQEIRITKSTSGLRQMGSGMGGVIELFTDAESANHNFIGANFEIGSYGYLTGGAIIRRQHYLLIPPANNKIKIQHQLNIDAANANNDYPFMHDNGTTIPTLRDPDPTWDDTLMRKNNNRYRTIDASYSSSAELSDNHKITQQISANIFDQGLFVYHYKADQSGLTSGHTLTYGIDYYGKISDRLTIGSEASGIYRYNALSDPDGRIAIGGTGKELESAGQAADILIDAQYSYTDNFYIAGMAGARIENHSQRNIALSDRPAMNRYEYRIGAEAGLLVGVMESVLRTVYKHELDTSGAGFGYWDEDGAGKKYVLRYPIVESVIRLDLHPVILQLSAAVSKRSPTFFERFGWSSGFLSNPDLREESRLEADIGAAVNMGKYSAAITIFAGRVEDKIKSIPQNSFVRVMNFADTEFYGAELEAGAKVWQFFTVELSASWLRSVIAKAADPGWIGKTEPFVPEFSGYLKTEIDIRQFNIGHGVRYESSCYLSIANTVKRSPQYELSAWLGYKVTDFFALRYRIDNYLGSANFDFLDNPMPRRVHVLSVVFNL